MKQMTIAMLLTMVTIIFSSYSFAEELYSGNINFKQVQFDNLKFAYDKGVQSEIDHDDIGYIFSAMAWQESSAGTITGEGQANHHAYGLFQNYLPTVRNRLKQKGLEYTDSNLKKMLSDPHYSAIFAEIELSYWLDYHKGDMSRALASYNAGFKWSKGKGYASSVLSKAKHLKDNDLGFLDHNNREYDGKEYIARI